jgi:FixJ family two-component response regulator
VTSAGLYIAVVDDEAPVRTALGRLLRLADYEVAAFASGDEFLASLAVRVPACVILDAHMPGISGFSVQAQLRAANCDVPAVFITASDDPALDASVVDAQGVALLRKPFTNDQLLKTVSAALGTRAGSTS